jgi:hypothetical protein
LQRWGQFSVGESKGIEKPDNSLEKLAYDIQRDGGENLRTCKVAK